jgi:hypothetical protein
MMRRMILWRRVKRGGLDATSDSVGGALVLTSVTGTL